MQSREVRVEDEEYEGDGFDEDDDRGSMVSNMRHGGSLEKLEIEKIVIWVVLR